MSGIVLVDSNVYIGLLHRRVDPAETLGSWVGDGDLAICGMVRVEVERGLKAPSLRRKMAGFFDVLINAPTNNRLWSEAADLAWELDRKGHVIPAQDCLIAVCARSIGAAVLTDDAHFTVVPHLKCFRPAEELPEW